MILAFSLLEDHKPWDAKTNCVVIMISIFSKNNGKNQPVVDAMLDALAPDCNVLEGLARSIEHIYASSGLWLTLAGFQSMHFGP